MSKQYLRKREYLGFQEAHYYLQYGEKIVIVNMKWNNREYVIVEAFKIKSLAKWTKIFVTMKQLPYKKTVGVIDRIEELLRE